MKTWTSELAFAGYLCLAITPAFCQDHPFVVTHPGSIGALRPIQKTEPEYSDEARVAQLEGQVVLQGWIDDNGQARDVQVEESLGLGLDEEAVDAIQHWQFKPPPAAQSSNQWAAVIAVEFRLPSKQSRWHLVGVHFDTPAGASRPIFVSALYPIGAGVGPEAIEEGRVLAAIGRFATAKLSFEINDQGLPVSFQVVNASDPIWGTEATALVGEWRFSPGMKDGIPITVPCSVELIWGAKELNQSALQAWRAVMDPH